MNTLSIPYFLLAILSIGARLGLSRPGDATGMRSFSINSLSPASSCSSPKKAVAHKATLSVIPRDGPCNSHSSSEEGRDYAQLLRLDKQRVTSIQSRISRGVIKGHEYQSLESENVRLPAMTGPSIGAGNYVVTIGLGTPKKDLTLIMDTGSDITWTQCFPCAVSCYRQKNPLFNPSQSSSYTNVMYSSTMCSQMASGTSASPGCYGSICTYGITYEDGSYSYGYFATDKLTLSQADTIDNFQIGCCQNNKGIFGKFDGMIGLGRDRISLVEQTATRYGRTFSYCLPKKASDIGYLSLSKNEVSSAVFTPMLTLSDPSFYGIQITGIMVGEKQLPMSLIISLRTDTIIDSGTMLTYLPKTVYVALRDAFRQGMSNYPMAPPYMGLDTCYDFSEHQTPNYPIIQFTFGGGVKVDLGEYNVFLFFSIHQVCLAFAANNDDNALIIYGSRQQLTFDVIYDIPGRRIGFARDGC